MKGQKGNVQASQSRPHHLPLIACCPPPAQRVFRELNLSSAGHWQLLSWSFDSSPDVTLTCCRPQALMYCAVGRHTEVFSSNVWIGLSLLLMLQGIRHCGVDLVYRLVHALGPLEMDLGIHHERGRLPLPGPLEGSCSQAWCPAQNGERWQAGYRPRPHGPGQPHSLMAPMLSFCPAASVAHATTAADVLHGLFKWPVALTWTVLCCPSHLLAFLFKSPPPPPFLLWVEV